jgi:hypothetical protein
MSEYSARLMTTMSLNGSSFKMTPFQVKTPSLEGVSI